MVSPFTRRAFLGGSLAAASTLALSGCASSPIGAGLFGSPLNPEQLIFWSLFGGGDGVRMQEMQAGYADANGGPGSLQATVFAWGNPYYSKLTLATVGNKPPDVAVAHLTRAKPLYDGGILDPITEEDLASVGMSSADFNPASWDAQKTDGTTIAIPLDTHPLVMFFNSDVCGQAGLLDPDGKLKDLTGLETFESALGAIAEVTGGTAITFGNVNETATPWRVFWTLYNQIDGVTPFLSDNGATISVDEDAFLQVTTKIQDWVNKGWLNTGLDYAGAQTAMFTGQSGIFLQGEWEITTAQSIEGLTFGMVPVPQLFDRPAVQADSHTFVLPRKDRTPEQRLQAMGFIKSMLDQGQTWAMGGHVPAYLPTLESADYKALEPQADYSSAADYAVYDDPAWYGGSGSTFEVTVGAQLALVQQLSLSPEGALKAIKDQLAIYTNTPSPL
ncbi:sugar ABC transporter substrate-binding protein [Rathayibacter sp. VKM Ac-2856]|uniref:sugar ABC transporter substrate-binding protein n=1 Tax=unclassified Rathayibacter TaxID=2609250 RepID=UPI001563BA12|nr:MULTISPECIES: sugar ABC transporter substrate-binding protein [unclassified Rathayibacter]NQX03721.1 sugar ABC transporter substrate-binding protein [Rathayibacter sp. VKM Ac-2858]NQX18889.1 sugar ABC transporter substrate-binding protein [Rathayibacter sp. VKM Ac-2856]